MADLPSALQYMHSATSLAQLSVALAAEPDVTHRLPAFQVTPASPVFSIPESEKMTIGRALTSTSGEKGKAARILGIGRTTLYRKMKQYGMSSAADGERASCMVWSH
jgi:two-component system response regulator HydG